MGNKPALKKNANRYISNKKLADLKINKDVVEKINEFNRRIVDSAPISIIIINKKGTITFVNEYFRQLSSSKFPLNRSIYKIPFFIRENLISAYENLLRRGIPINKEHCRTKNLSGETKYINIIAVPLKDKHGKIEGALSMAVDVTETVTAKLRLEISNANLEENVAQRTYQLSEINKRLEKSLELKMQFISDAAHELRTPLSIMRLNLELSTQEFLAKRKNPPEVFSIIGNEIGKVSEILSDLTLLTSIDSGYEKIKIENIDIGRLLEDTASRLIAIAGEKNIDVKYKKSREKMKIKGDKIKLEKLFLNIIRNAIKYGNKNGWIKAQAKKIGKRSIEINISDNGIGIPKDELPYIFDRFYRTSLCREKSEGGFGLGLSICRWIVEKHNGAIAVKSSIGKGSIFTINLPIGKK